MILPQRKINTLEEQTILTKVALLIDSFTGIVAFDIEDWGQLDFQHTSEINLLVWNKKWFYIFFYSVDAAGEIFLWLGADLI